MFFSFFLTVAAVTLSAPAPQSTLRPPGWRHVAVRLRPEHPAAAGLDPGQLYSLRARRRFAAYLRLRLLEMREAGLERAADVIERKLPVDELVPESHPRLPHA